MNPDSLIHILQGRGFRMTSIRRFLLHLFSESRAPLSAHDLIGALKKARLECNRTTVYRELNFLVAQNVIKSVDFGDGLRRYELSGGAHHHHFICSSCKKVIDVMLDNDLDAEEGSLAKRYDMRIESHSLEFFGLCKECK